MDSAPSPQTDAAAGPAAVAVAPVPKAVLAPERQARRRPSCKWKPSSAAPRRWPWCSPTTAPGFRWSSCASHAASRATAARQATSSAPRAPSASTPRAFARSPRRCTNCRCPASSTGTSIISWCWKGIDGGDVYINDPAIGRRRTDMVELDLAFTGVALAMEPTAAVPAVGQQAAGLAAAAARIALLEDRRGLLVARQPRAGRARDRRRRDFPRSSSTTS